MAQFDLVFEGGGAKGSAFVGALTELTKAGHSPRRLVGTSAGAITATLLGARYSPDEMLTEVTRTTTDSRGDTLPVFATFMDPPTATSFTKQQLQNSDIMELLSHIVPNIPFRDRAEQGLLDGLLKLPTVCELFSLEECSGFYAGDAFLAWFKQRLANKGLDPAITWDDFALKTGSDVSVVTSDTRQQERVVLNARTAPKAPVAESVRMSMSIPFVWRQMEWKQEWGTYLNSDRTGHIFVDGGVLSNFPIRLVEDTDDDTLKIMGKTDPNGAGTIGLLLDETLPVPGIGDIQTRPPRLKIAGSILRLVDTMTGASDNEAMRLYTEKICHIPVGGCGTTEFRMPSEKLARLVQSGADAMHAFLLKHDASAMAAKVTLISMPKVS
jgi:predicted acylesterase/phospholipase RssA